MDGDFRSPAHMNESLRGRVHAMPDLPAYDVRVLMEGGAQALMVLDGVSYSLRITRSGKLILTK